MSSFLSVTLEDAAGNQLALRFFDFNTSSFNRSRSVTQQRSSFSPAFKAFGDNHPDRAVLTLSGPVFADSITDFEAAWREVIAFAMQAQWVKTQAYQFEVLRLQLDSQARNNQIRSDDVRTLTLRFLLEHPYKASLAETVSSEVLVAGVNTFDLTNEGDVDTWPIFEITGSDITGVTLTIGVRTLQLSGLTLGSNTLLVNTRDGVVDLNGVDLLPSVADNSQFPKLPKIGASVFMTVVGGDGNVVVKFRDLYY